MNRLLTGILLALPVAVYGHGRVANITVNMPFSPPSEAIIVVEDAFSGLSFSAPLCLRTAPGDSERLFVCEKGGDIELIPDVTAGTPTKTTFLNLDSIVSARADESFTSSGEQGLLSAAFHPDYATNGFLFTVYNVRIDGVNYQRLSRWHDPDISDVLADPSSEKILIEMRNEASNHNGGDLHFGPDGYLYMSWGDEGQQNDSLNNGQFIDGDFWSSVIRIDVNLEVEDYGPNDGSGGDDANLRPNAHPAVVLHDGDPLYEVPADNPWVGASSFNGVSVNPVDVRTEFYAVGFRNPWRFSFDSLTGELWLGDVGENAYEEVAVIDSGSNHGWAWMEGDGNGPKFNNTINGANRLDATLVAPDWDYARGSGEFQGSSVTGGLVQRGGPVEALEGKYLFADYGSGNIWALERTDIHGSPSVERIAGASGVVGFGVDPSTGHVLLANINQGKIQRLVSSFDSEAPSCPWTLSQTGIFSDLASLSLNSGVIPYDVNVPFWSDHAIKQRWFVLNNIDETFAYSEDGAWGIPFGTVFVKHFELELERGNPSTSKRIETRVFVDYGPGGYGVSYRWNDEETEAYLVDSSGETFDLSILVDEALITQTWHIPSQAQCLSCHQWLYSNALSFNTRQLNRDAAFGEHSGNFVSMLYEHGYLDSLPKEPQELPKLVGADAEEYSLEARVRSYLDVNCVHCHTSKAPFGLFSWFADYDITLDETQLVNGWPLHGLNNIEDRLVVHGQTLRSILVSRIEGSQGYSKMPPLGNSEVDEVNLQLLIDWINQEVGLSSRYEDWRLLQFGDITSANGAPDVDADGDKYTNQEEWLAQTDPKDPSDLLVTSMTYQNGGPAITLPSIPSRSVCIERSTDLNEWSFWDVPENDGIPRQLSTPEILWRPAVGDREFFRYSVEER